MASAPGRGAQVRLDGELQRVARGGGASRLADTLLQQHLLEQSGAYADGSTPDGSTLTGDEAKDEVLAPGGKAPNIEAAIEAGATAGTAAVQQALEGAVELQAVQIATAPTLPGQIARLAEVTGATTLAVADANAGDPRALVAISNDELQIRNFWRSGDADWSNAIQRAIDYGAAQGGATIRVPRPKAANTPYVISRTMILRTGIHISMDRRAVIKLADGANCTMFEGESFQTLTGTNSGAGISDWGFDGYGTLDGNRAANTAAQGGQGHGIAVYGRNFRLMVRVQNTARRGIHLEYGNSSVGTSPFNGYIERVLTNMTGEEGLWLAVSDMHVLSANVRRAGINTDNTFDGVYSAFGLRIGTVNIWGGAIADPHMRYALNLNGGGSTVMNAHVETGKTANIRLGGDGGHQMANVLTYNYMGDTNVLLESSGNVLQVKGSPGNIGPREAVGIRVGSASFAAYNNDIDCFFTNNDLGLVDLTYSGGSNTIRLRGYNATATDTPVVGWTRSTDTVHGMVAGDTNVTLTGGRGLKAVQFGHGANASQAFGVSIGPGTSSSASGGIALGNNAAASGINSLALGNNVQATTLGSSATGSRARTTLTGEQARAGWMMAKTGDAQESLFFLGTKTTDATPKSLAVSGPSGTASLVLDLDSLLDYRIDLFGYADTDTSKFYHATYSGLIRRVSGAGTSMLVGPSPTVSAGVAAGWDAVVSADASAGALKILVTGDPSLAVTWFARVTAGKVLL
jgi:hypothetical protein